MLNDKWDWDITNRELVFIRKNIKRKCVKVRLMHDKYIAQIY